MQIDFPDRFPPITSTSLARSACTASCCGEGTYSRSASIRRSAISDWSSTSRSRAYLVVVGGLGAKLRAASMRRWSTSAFSSSSDQNVRGFFDPPCSAFVVTSRVIISSILLLVAEPGFASKYCFIITAEKPPTPPKYSITFSSSSALWGTVAPPTRTADSMVSTARVSIAAILRSRASAFRARRRRREAVTQERQTSCFFA